MKQCITLKQWDELNFNQKQLLTDYKRRNDHSEYKEMVSTYEWLTIGQMIEFLGEDLVEMNRYTKDDMTSGKSWWICCNPIPDMSYKRDNLCNALWAACKYKLNGDYGIK